MEEIVQAIEELSQKTWVDYLLIVVPIAISIVAIVISVCISNKQNRIALYNYRYNAALQVETLIELEKIVYKENSPELIVAAFDMFFGTNIRSQETLIALMQAAQKTKSVQQDIGCLIFIVDKKHKSALPKLLDSFSALICGAINGVVDEDAKESFHSVCIVLNDEFFIKLLKKIKI